jgi:hypothetical protein
MARPRKPIRNVHISYNLCVTLHFDPLRVPLNWVRELANPTHPRYPVSGSIAGQPCLRGGGGGGNTGVGSSKLGVGPEADNLTL